jgi:hypothetical protein
MINTTEIAKRVWETAYPDRRPWDKLEPDTRDEWERFVLIALIEYEKLKYENRSKNTQ